jgi:hypothetical protein
MRLSLERGYLTSWLKARQLLYLDKVLSKTPEGDTEGVTSKGAVGQ